MEARIKMFDNKHKELKQTTDYHESRICELSSRISALDSNDVMLAQSHSTEIGRLEKIVKELSKRADNFDLFMEQIRPCFTITEIPGEGEVEIDATPIKDKNGNPFVTSSQIAHLTSRLEQAMRDGRTVDITIGGKQPQTIVELKAEMLPRKKGGR